MAVIVKDPVVVMTRYEMKYLLDQAQVAFLRERLPQHMRADRFGLTSIASLYYDTPDYRLIRTSIEKPPFKEKIRLRSYGLATETSPVFLELKRKAYGIVYKRRVETTIPLVHKFFAGEGDICAGGQINREITYFRDYYGTLAPSCLIAYDRIAYFEPGTDLRVTIDHDPRYRVDDLTLTHSMAGTPLLPPGGAILEIKVQGAMPLWLPRLLDEGGIRKSSFSKYGAAYQHQLLAHQAH
ncbi:MAG: polyphosphate polymerase domain-containing protein [Clostridia bacterium]|nr:polyphosphate polymerase domain-containing protein [Clostridia bacterium]